LVGEKLEENDQHSALNSQLKAFVKDLKVSVTTLSGGKTLSHIAMGLRFLKLRI
jgi:hypothetical protein